MLPHHKLGCLHCGARRRIEDVRNKTYDVYLQDESGTMVRVGLCRDCYGNTLDLKKMQDNLVQSELDCKLEQGVGVETAVSHSDVFKKMKLEGHEFYKDTWKKADPLEFYKSKKENEVDHARE